MSEIALAGIERQLVGLLQRDFPLVENPFLALAQKMGADESTVLGAIAGLKNEGIVRQISPVLDARRLGYQSTLVAMSVAPVVMAQAAEIIAAHPGVSHCYERDHRFNLWFTLSLPANKDEESEVANLWKQTGAEIAFSLPAIRLFKIGAYFDVDGETAAPAVGRQQTLPERVELSSAERIVVNFLQQDLPLVPHPFDGMAGESGMSTLDFLTHCRAMVERGIIRRYGASINHRRVGFHANVMVCWTASAGMIDCLGQELASLKEVSHCYERKTNRHWKYNVFAMVHGNTREMCEAMVSRVADETGKRDYAMLYSTREFKKTRIRYAV